VAVAVTFILLPGLAVAGMVEGSIQGLTCVTIGKVCPVGMEDPLIAHEQTFGVYTYDNEFYFVSNMDRAILSRYINKRVRVTGDINKQYKTVNAENLQVFKDEKWETPWSLQLEEAIKLQIYGPNAK
jgi:hypothetical protein